MRKKELLEQNISLFDQLQKSRFEIEQLNHRILRQADVIRGLQARLEELESTVPEAIPEQEPEVIEESMEVSKNNTVDEPCFEESLFTPDFADEDDVLLDEVPVLEEPTEEAEYEKTPDEGPLFKVIETQKLETARQETEFVKIEFPKLHIVDIEVNDVTQYGAEIIGKIVVAAAQNSNTLTAGGETKYRELVNLILGKTEVAKADILSAVNSETTFEIKKNIIDDVYESTLEYFESVMAQRI